MRVVFVRVVWDGQALPFRIPGVRSFDCHVRPEPGYPYGRKGLALLGAWRQLGTGECTGMVVMDGDVVADPLDVATMLGTVSKYPLDVWTAPIKLWPASTQRDNWVWGHWDAAGPSQRPVPDPTFFSFGLTYLPRRVLEAAARRGLAKWTFPNVDGKMSQAAQAAGVKVRVVDGCQPKHLHY